MRKPRADDRWDRTPTGLIVPRRPTLPTRRYINPLGSTSCACCDPDCTCKCYYGEGDDYVCVPCCWKVTLPAFTENTCGDCDCAGGVIGAWGGGGCSWVGDTCSICGGGSVSIVLVQTTETWTLTATSGDNVWETSGEGEMPWGNKTLAVDTASGDCLANGSLTLQAYNGTETSCDALSHGTCCENIDSAMPKRLTVTVTGSTEHDPAECIECGCFNNTFCLNRSCGCTWRGSTYGECDGDCGTSLSLTITESGGDYTATISGALGTWTQDLGSSPPDVITWPSGSWVLSSNTCCDMSGATLTVASGDSSCLPIPTQCSPICDCGITPAFGVTISGVDDDFCDCSGIDGYYIVPILGACNYNISILESLPCDVGARTLASVSILFYDDAGTYTMRVSITLSTRTPQTCTVTAPQQQIFYFDLTSASKIECSKLNGEDVPYSFTYLLQCPPFTATQGICGLGVGAEVTVTSLN